MWRGFWGKGTTLANALGWDKVGLFKVQGIEGRPSYPGCSEQRGDRQKMSEASWEGTILCRAYNLDFIQSDRNHLQVASSERCI